MKNNIKKLRKAKKMTQDELAEKIGSSKQHIWYLEKGYRKLTLEWIIKISKALNCSVQDLVCEEDLTEIKNSELPNNYKVEEKNFHPNIIYKLRKQQKVTLQELADIIGTSKMQVWYLEHGIRKLKPKWAEEIAKALNCSVSDLFSETQNEIFEDDEFSNLTEEEKNLIRTFRKIKEDENNKTAKAE